MDLKTYIIEALSDYKPKKHLGSGQSGDVYDLGGGKVLKKISNFYEQVDNIEDFYKYCHANNPKEFPKIYEFGKDYVVMEKLNPETDKCFQYGDLICNFDKKQWKDINIPKSWVKRNDAFFLLNLLNLPKDKLSKAEDAIKEMGGIHQEVYEWLKSVLEILDEVGIEWWDTDFKPENLGERKNGEVVWFDI